MKNAAARFNVLALVVLTSIQLNAASLLFEFQDPLGDNPLNMFIPTGDVSNGLVVVDTDNGACSVTLSAAGSGFNYSILIKLNLINSHPDRTGVVTLSAVWPGNFTSETTITFSSDDPGFSVNPGFINWQAGDPIQLSGIVDGINYASGTYSTDGVVLYDGLAYSGFLVADPNAVPQPASDSDGDGIPDESDLNNESDFSETVSLLGAETGISNITSEEFMLAHDGLTLADVIAAMEASADANSRNHGQYVQELVRNFKLLEKDGFISNKDNAGLVGIIVQSRK